MSELTPPPSLSTPITRRSFLTGAGMATVVSGLRPDSRPAESPTLSAQEANDLLTTSANSLKQTVIAALVEPQKKSLAPIIAGATMVTIPRENAKAEIPPHSDDPIPKYDPSIVDQYLTPGQHDQPPSPTRRRLLKTLAVGAGAFALEEIAQRTGLLNQLFEKTKTTIMERLKGIKAAPVSYDSAKLFTPPPAEAATIDHTETPPPTTPTKEAKQLPKKDLKEAIAGRHAVEFLLGDLVRQFQNRRLERITNDPAAAERIQPELLRSDTLNFLYLGTDNTRERPKEFTDKGWGRSDTIILISFNPHTLKSTAISLPRDLYAPEINAIKINGQGLGEGRINGITMANYVNHSIDTFSLARQVIESATGMPIDAVIQTNLDFMQGFEEDHIPSIFDTLFPDGLEIDVPRRIIDKEYPIENYGKKTLVIEQGKQSMNGRLLVEYGRTRHSVGSDFGRASRQRQILTAAIKKFLPNIAQDAVTSSSTTLDTTISAITKQEEFSNLASDVNLAQIAKTIKSYIQNMRSTAQGTAALAVLAANTVSHIKTLQENNESLFSSFGLSRDNKAVSGIGLLTLTGANTRAKPTEHGNHLAYWKPLRELLKGFFLGDTTNNIIETTPAPPPPKEERIIYPNELSYEEVRPYIGRLRNCTDSVITESLFTKEVAAMQPAQRKKTLTAIAKAHANALYEHYGDAETIIGIDPGHGGSESGSSATKTDGGTLVEKDLNWKVCQMIAEEVYNLTQGKYTVVFLRPPNPHDQDINKDEYVSTIERLQKRKALLVKTEEEIRMLSPWDKGNKIVYLSVHFNGSPDASAKGTEVFYPNETATTNDIYRLSSKKLAEKLQSAIAMAIQDSGYPTANRGAKEDPAKATPTSHRDAQGPYIMLDSPKLDWDPADPTKPYNKTA